MRQNGRSGGGEKRGVFAVKAVLVFLLLLVSVGLTVVGCSFGFGNAEPEPSPTPTPISAMRYAQGIRINGHNVGGLTLDGARDIISGGKKQVLGDVSVCAGHSTRVLDASSAIVTTDMEQILEDAIMLGNVGTSEQRAAEREEIMLNGREFSVATTYDLSPVQSEVERVAQELSFEPVNAEAVYNPENPELFDFTDGADGLYVDADALFEAFRAYVDAGSFNKILNFEGETLHPAVTTEMARAGNSLISTTTSSFKKGSYGKANRVHNITKAAGIISGVVVGPSEEFSFNDTVGPRTAKNGWLEAGAISDGTSVDEIGGGICQVSSTLFNSVVKADLEIVRRSSHSWPLSYLPAGQDATVSTGGPDFVFKNSKETPVIIVAIVDPEEKCITVSIYGTPDPRGYRVELESERVASIPKPEPQTQLNSALRPGSSTVIREARAGSKYETYKLYYDGDELVERVLAYKTTYRAIAELREVGPAVETAGDSYSDDVTDEIIDDGTDADIPDETELF